MKHYLTCIAVFLSSLSVYGQEKLFALGYTQTFVTNDSSTLGFTLDLNRIPGQSEKAGGVYLLNNTIGSTKFGYYIKPTADVNVGSSVSSAPNNISVGMPIGLAYDIPKTPIGIFTAYLDVSPELVADKGFRNNLYYLSQNLYVKYELNSSVLINLIGGLSHATGNRDQYEVGTSRYRRFTIPAYLKMAFWNDTSRKEKAFKRISWITTYKYNSVYADYTNPVTNDGAKGKSYNFVSSKFDFYITPNFGINVTYFNGFEEPLFKRNNSLSLGVSFAR